MNDYPIFKGLERDYYDASPVVPFAGEGGLWGKIILPSMNNPPTSV